VPKLSVLSFCYQLEMFYHFFQTTRSHTLIQHILNLERDYPNARTILLEQNYRSHQTILDVANALISYNSGRLGEKEL
jgi:ATP-dependent exoDNAse (exonuclease V) beta subunit